MAYCNRLSVKMASENSSEDEFETLHGHVRPYLFKMTINLKSGLDKPDISVPQCHLEVGTQLIR